MMETLNDSGVEITNEPEKVFIRMDIQSTQSTIEDLRNLIASKIKKNVAGYTVWLQNYKIFTSSETLSNQCVKVEGLAQVNAEIHHGSKYINIIDVVTPTEEDDVMECAEENSGLDDLFIVKNERDHGNASSDSIDRK